MENLKPVVMFGAELKREVEYLKRVIGYIYFTDAGFWKGHSYITKNNHGCFETEDDAKQWVICESIKGDGPNDD